MTPPEPPNPIPGLEATNELGRFARRLRPRSARLADWLAVRVEPRPSAGPEWSEIPAMAERVQERSCVDARAARDLALGWLVEMASELNRGPAEGAREPDSRAVLDFCEGLATWASLSRELGDPEDGLLALLHALDLASARPRSASYARILRRAPNFLTHFGRHEHARATLLTALDIFIACDAPDPELGATLCLLASHHIRQGETEAAAATFERARRLIEAGGGPSYSSLAASSGAAWAHLHLGQLEQAEELATLLASSDGFDGFRVTGLWLRAALLDARGKKRDALDVYWDAAALARAADEPALPALVLLDAALVASELGDARELARVHDALDALGPVLPAAGREALRPWAEAGSSVDLPSGEVDLVAAQDRARARFRTALCERLVRWPSRAGGGDGRRRDA